MDRSWVEGLVTQYSCPTGTYTTIINSAYKCKQYPFLLNVSQVELQNLFLACEISKRKFKP